MSATPQATNQWMLFGLDMRRIGHIWLAAWRDLLLAPSSPVRRHLDEPVLLYSDSGVQLFQGGRLKQLSGPEDASTTGGSADAETVGTATCTARLLPDTLVLTRRLSVPRAAEAELESVLAMEITASSPFADDDTVYGYCERERDETTISLSLAIASQSAVSSWLREHPLHAHGDEANADQMALGSSEVWASADGDYVTLNGFGEGRREQAYRARLVRCALYTGGILALLLVAVSLFALQQRTQLERMEVLQASVQQETRTVARMREVLATANETIGAANALVAQYPNPHLQIARLTELLDDSVHVARFEMSGRDIRIRGRATDAAEVMQTLAEEPTFEAVTAPQAITAVGNTGLEQFHLDIELASASEDEGGS